jgi:hypothetical protein
MICSRQKIDFLKPYSWVTPFFPMRKYPVHFWGVMAFSLMIAGGIIILLDVILKNGHEAFGGFFFLWGFGILITIKIWLKYYTSCKK